MTDRTCYWNEMGGICPHEPHEHCPNEFIKPCENQCQLCKEEAIKREVTPMTDKMTITEALEHSRRELEAYRLKAKDRPFYQREVDYYEIVVEALELQMPKKLKVDERCPTCFSLLNVQDRCCGECGQVIDWESDTDG